MVPFEASIAILNHIAHSRLVPLNNLGHWRSLEKPAHWNAQVLVSLRDGPQGPAARGRA
jgi:pimeloyl-ACP methyl ester carboxylesterase